MIDKSLCYFVSKYGIHWAHATVLLFSFNYISFHGELSMSAQGELLHL